jgi:hypothetical protein
MLEFKDLRNETDLVFIDISSEQYRIYEFLPDFDDVVINSPIALNVGANGHRILDAQGVSHYVANGWKHLYWEVKENQPHFVK